MSQRPIVSVTRRLHRLFVTSVAVVLLITGLVVLCFEFYNHRNQLIDRAHVFSSLTSPQLAHVVMTESPMLATLLLECNRATFLAMLCVLFVMPVVRI